MESPKPNKTFDQSDFLVFPADMIRFMDAHFSTTTCPQCGKDDGWEMDGHVDESGVSKLIIYRMTYATSEATFRPYFSMSCNACGSMRKIIGDKVMGWLATHPGEATDDR
jgi:hypothetical protein